MLRIVSLCCAFVLGICFAFVPQNWIQTSGSARAANGQAVFNLFNYGGLCDGSHVDTQAFVDAFASAGPTRGTVLVPGTLVNNCAIDAAIALPPNIQLRCESPTTTITQITSGQPVLKDTDNSNIVIENCKLIGSDSDALRITSNASDISGLVIRGVSVFGFGTSSSGILFDIASTHAIKFPFIENVTINGGGIGSRIGINFGGAGSSLTVGAVIVGSRITNVATGLSCAHADTIRSDGLSIDGTSVGLLSSCDQLRMWGTRFEANTVYIQDSGHDSVIWGTFAETTPGLINGTGTANTYLGSDGSSGLNDIYGNPFVLSKPVKLSSTVQTTTVKHVSQLGTCNSSIEGTRVPVDDALSPTFLGTLTGGGSVHVPGYCNGSNWVAY